MAQEWYYTKDGDRQGPVTPQQLKQLAASGDLQPTDLIWKDGMAEWKPAKSLKGLFQATSQPKATEPPSISGHSKPTAPAPSKNEVSATAATSVGPTNRPGLLRRAKEKFVSLTTPQKFLVGGVGGMGVFFFLCMGTCGLFGVLGSFVGPQNSTSVARTTPSGIQGRWWVSEGRNGIDENGVFGATVLIIDGSTMKTIRSDGLTTLKDITIRTDVEPHQIDIGWDKLDPELTPGRYNPLIERVNNETSYGIYEIKMYETSLLLTIRTETKGNQEYRPKNFTDAIGIGENYQLALRPEFVREEIWMPGDPPSKYRVGEENGYMPPGYKRTTDFK